MILVPVKNLADAKQRLSSVLSPEERFALAQAMCEDVLQALARWQSRPPVAVVTSDSFARDLAARFNFEVVADDNSGETSAIEMATAVCRERGADEHAGGSGRYSFDRQCRNCRRSWIALPPVARCWCRTRPDAARMQPGDLQVICFRFASETTASCRTWPRRRQRACLVLCSNCRGLRAMSIVPKIFANWRLPAENDDRRSWCEAGTSVAGSGPAWQV